MTTTKSHTNFSLTLHGVSVERATWLSRAIAEVTDGYSVPIDNHFHLPEAEYLRLEGGGLVGQYSNGIFTISNQNCELLPYLLAKILQSFLLHFGLSNTHIGFSVVHYSGQAVSANPYFGEAYYITQKTIKHHTLDGWIQKQSNKFNANGMEKYHNGADPLDPRD